jgi:hypothetical protein
VSSVSSVSTAQEKEVEELQRRGFTEWAARQEFLARDHPLDCCCEVCR